MRSLTNAIRAQAHEFSNRLHTVAGLIELGHHDEAVSFVTGHDRRGRRVPARARPSVADPRHRGAAARQVRVAGERGVSCSLTEHDRLAHDWPTRAPS